jgi:hypothetical protein
MARKLRETYVATAVRVAASGARDVNTLLQEWLCGVPQLRGHLDRHTVPPAPDQMGTGAGELVVALASTGMATALVKSLQIWLTNRHSDVTITVTAPDGRQASVTAARVPDLSQVRDLIDAVLILDEAPTQQTRSDGQQPRPPDPA